MFQQVGAPQCPPHLLPAGWQRNVREVWCRSDIAPETGELHQQTAHSGTLVIRFQHCVFIRRFDIVERSVLWYSASYLSVRPSVYLSVRHKCKCLLLWNYFRQILRWNFRNMLNLVNILCNLIFRYSSIWKGSAAISLNIYCWNSINLKILIYDPILIKFNRR